MKAITPTRAMPDSNHNKSPALKPTTRRSLGMYDMFHPNLCEHLPRGPGRLAVTTVDRGSAGRVGGGAAQR